MLICSDIVISADFLLGGNCLSGHVAYTGSESGYFVATLAAG